MLDQPTQAYYPSEVAQRSGLALEDADREAVLRIFTLLRDFVADLGGRMQVIVRTRESPAGLVTWTHPTT